MPTTYEILSLLIAFLAAVPGILALWQLHRAKATKVEAKFYMYPFQATYPGVFFVQLKFHPGESGTVITAVESSYGVAVAAKLSTVSVPFDATPVDVTALSDGRLHVHWDITSRTSQEEPLFVTLLLKSMNLEQAQAIEFELLQEKCLISSIKRCIHHKIRIQLKTTPAERIPNPHSEILI